MNKRNYFLGVLLGATLLGSTTSLVAQQDPQYSMYMFNPLSVNPAYAGSRDALSVTLLGRKQWVSIPGAPLTGTFTIHSPLKNEAIALGLSVIHDEIGATQNTGVFGDAAYRFALDKKGTIVAYSGINTFSSYSCTCK